MNFKRLVSDPCIYIKRDINNNIICIIGMYVDDILLTGTDNEINKTKTLLTKYFELSDLGEIKYIIGIQFEKLKDGYLIHQEKYINDILNKFNFSELKPTSNMTPTQDIKLKENYLTPKISTSNRKPLISGNVHKTRYIIRSSKGIKECK